MTTPSDADAGLLAKLDAAELRIGLCEDANLAKLLDPALPNLLNFLTSTPPVRAKLMAILSHLNKRVKGNAEIALPLRGLAELYLRPAAAPVVANFALVYLEMGLPRADLAQVLEAAARGHGARARVETLHGGYAVYGRVGGSAMSGSPNG